MKRRTSSILVILILEALLATLSLADAADDPAIRLPTDSTSVEALVEGVRRRPWKCCDFAICTRSYTPTCFCKDKVKRCSLACKKCERVSLWPRLYQCKDSYFGFPGPKCKKNDEEYVSGSNPVGTDVEEIVEEIVEEMETSTATGGGVGRRPWKCCNVAFCTKSNPPICSCMDKMKRCSLACKDCERVSLWPRLYQCKDRYRGHPGPKCKTADEEFVTGDN